MSGTIIVTGGGRGIGAATSLLAAQHGYGVAVNYRDRSDRAEAIVAAIEAKGGRAVAIPGNVAVEADVVRLFDQAAEKLGPVTGPITGLVNNAGVIGPRKLLADVTVDILREVLEVNVIGAFLCAREAVRRFSTARGGKGGAIVNVSSIAAVLGGTGEYIHYAASKGAIETMTVGLAREVAQEGIRVNAVMPGLIETEIHAAAGMADRVERLAPTVPMGRGGKADEVAEAILWLLSDGASYVTGTSIRVAGGR